MEPERPIEKLLRASAAQRRDEVGEPLQLHPATRRLLQGEVARTFGSDRAPDPSATAFGWSWPRLAWGGAILAGLVAAASLMLPRQNASRREFALALNSRPLDREAHRERVAPPSASVAEAAAAPASGPLARAGVVQNAPIGAKGEMAQLPAASAGARASANSLAGSPGDSGRDARKTELAFKSLPAPAVGAPTAAASEKDYNLVDAYIAGVPTMQRFNQVSSRRAELRLDDPAKPQVVLSSFALEQRGQAVRVVDADGSVYVGTMQAAASVSGVSSQGVAKAAKARMMKAAPAYQSNAPGSEDEKRIPFSFRVSGTNRSLNQPVVFTGQFLAATNLLALAPATNAVARGGAADKTGASPPNLAVSPFVNTRISGKAVIGSGQEIEVNAEPASP